jgi:hypothetical protein
LPWDDWLTISSAILPITAFGTTDIPGAEQPDLLAQMLSTTHSLPDSSVHPTQWPTPASGPSSTRKRRRAHERPGDQVQENDSSPASDFLTSGEELPFHLMS